VNSRLSVLILTAGTFLIGVLAWASDASQDPHAIPWKAITIQVANLGLLLVYLGYVLRKTVKAYFSGRIEVYRDLVSRADQARQEAERNRAQIASRLTDLEAGAKQSLAKANAEAGELRQRILNEAKDLTNKLTDETQRSIQVELEKARTQLREELLNAAIESARTSLKEKIGGAEQKKLQKEFVDKIQVVQ